MAEQLGQGPIIHHDQYMDEDDNLGMTFEQIAAYEQTID